MSESDDIRDFIMSRFKFLVVEGKSNYDLVVGIIDNYDRAIEILEGLVLDGKE